MKKIISVSRRTDIPAFYSEWFINRVREGFVKYRNPFYPSLNYNVDLSPENTAGFVFWTRDPMPLIPFLNELEIRDYFFYFLITITNYPRSIEPYTPPVEKTLEALKLLSEVIGKKRIIWRYDPLILNSTGLSFEWHKRNFYELLIKLKYFTEKIIVSVVDPYKKTYKNLNADEEYVCFIAKDYIPLLEWMQKVSYDNGIEIQTCSEPVSGMNEGACISADLFEKLSGKRVTRSKHKQRNGCHCSRSIDIGAYNTCGFGCRYCYATSNHSVAKELLKKHNSTWNSLTCEL